MLKINTLKFGMRYNIGSGLLFTAQQAISGLNIVGSVIAVTAPATVALRKILYVFGSASVSGTSQAVLTGAFTGNGSQTDFQITVPGGAFSSGDVQGFGVDTAVDAANNPIQPTSISTSGVLHFSVPVKSGCTFNGGVSLYHDTDKGAFFASGIYYALPYNSQTFRSYAGTGGYGVSNVFTIWATSYGYSSQPSAQKSVFLGDFTPDFSTLPAPVGKLVVDAFDDNPTQTQPTSMVLDSSWGYNWVGAVTAPDWHTVVTLSMWEGGAIQVVNQFTHDGGTIDYSIQELNYFISSTGTFYWVETMYNPALYTAPRIGLQHAGSGVLQVGLSGNLASGVTMKTRLRFDRFQA